MRFLFRAAALVLLATAASASTCRSNTKAVTMLFDGGFLFVEHTDGTLSVVSPREAGAHHEARLEITSPSMAQSYPIKEWQISLETGAGAATVELPARRQVQQSEADCTPIPRDSSAANNQSWLPDLSELHPNQTLDLSPANIESRIQLTRGRLDVAMAYGCWQLKSASVTTRPQSLVYGDNSVEYVTQTTDDSVKLVFTPLAGNTEQPFDVPISLKDVEKVVIEVGYPRMNTKGTPAGQPMADFSRHYRLLPRVSAIDRYVPVAKIDHSSGGPGTIPGRECASAKFTEPAGTR